MRSWKVPLFVVFAAASSAVVLSVACGSPPKTPEGGGEGGTPAPGDTAASSGATPSDQQGTGGTTTTSQLDASDLQGQKLTGGSRKEIETKGDGGPRTPRSGSAEEPGRRREDIRTIILTHRDEARACYDKALKDHPGIEGDIEIKWTIDPDGNVTSPEVDEGKSQIHEPSVGKCIIDVIKNIKFAKSDKGYESHARYPFNFHPKASQLKKDGGS